MAKYRKKPVEVEATQWWKNGDHPEDDPAREGSTVNGEFWEGKVFRYYRHPEDDGQRRCETCDCAMHHHGWIDTAEGGHIVCPGDYIITDTRAQPGHHGYYYPCKPHIFAKTYEPVEE